MTTDADIFERRVRVVADALLHGLATEPPEVAYAATLTVVRLLARVVLERGANPEVVVRGAGELVADLTMMAGATRH